MRILFLVVCSFLMTGCGYRWGKGGVAECYSSVRVPYVEGDKKGAMTAALINRVASTGTLNYVSCGGDLSLKVCLLLPRDTNIGYIYAPGSGGKVSNIVVANEARLTLRATVSLVDCSNGKCIMGPVEIASSLTYDYEPDLSNVNFHRFSLGQLEMHDLAKDGAFPALYDQLAQKIVDYVNHSW